MTHPLPMPMPLPSPPNNPPGLGVGEGETTFSLLEVEPTREKPLSHRPRCQQEGSPDDFQTPVWALEPLLPYLEPFGTIWEPACGKGNLVGGLLSAGHAVIKTDLRYGAAYDFLRHEPPHAWDCIVTNPPYSIKDEWIARCYALGKPWALLVPFTVLEKEGRQAMYRRHGVELLYFNRRVPFETPTGKASSPWFPVLWLCWKLLPASVVFHEMRAGVQEELSFALPPTAGQGRAGEVGGVG